MPPFSFRVVGTIDLSAINQSTRPKKKSNAEKRRARNENGGQNGQSGRRRQRIGKETIKQMTAGKSPGGHLF